MTLPLFSPIIPLPPPLWLLSVYSLFQCLWLYFACLFVFFIRFLIFIFLTFFYCCSSTVVSIFSPPLSTTPPTATSHPQSYPTLALSMDLLYIILDDLHLLRSYYPPLPSPVVTVSLVFISMSLVLFCLFVLLIRFQLKVRSYGICLSPPGLHHLA